MKEIWKRSGSWDSWGGLSIGDGGTEFMHGAGSGG